MGSPRKRRRTARPELPRPKRESARFPQPMDGLPKCSAQFAERCLGVRASLRASAGRPTGKHRLHCSSIDPAVRNAAGCGPSQRLRLLARGSGKFSTPAEVLGLLTSESTCVRPVHPHAVHRAAETDANPIEHAWSDQHCEATKPPSSQADRAWREIALLQQAGYGQDATRVAAHWNQRRITRTSSALRGDVVERAGGFIGSREAGSRGRGGQQEPNRMGFTGTEASPYPTP